MDEEVIYTIVVYDSFGEPLRRIPEKDKAVADMVATYLRDEGYVVIILEEVLDV